MRRVILAAAALSASALAFGPVHPVAHGAPEPSGSYLCEVITRQVTGTTSPYTQHSALECWDGARSHIVEDNWAAAGTTAAERAAGRTGNRPFVHDGTVYSHLRIDGSAFARADCKRHCDAVYESRTQGRYPDAPSPEGTASALDGYNPLRANFCWPYTNCVIECLIDNGGTPL